MQRDRLLYFARGGDIAVVFQIENFSLQKRAVLIDLQNLEAFLPLSKDVHSPVRILLQNIQDFRGAADFRQLLFLGANDSEMLILIEALRDHLFVARLKNVQRHGYPRQQHQIQRK